MARYHELEILDAIYEDKLLKILDTEEKIMKIEYHLLSDRY